MMRLRSSIAIALLLGCGRSSGASDGGDSDAAIVTADYKVAWISVSLQVWHSRDGTIETLKYPAQSPGYPFFSPDGKLLLARKSNSSLDIIDETGVAVSSEPAPTQMPAFTWAAPRPDFKRFLITASTSDGGWTSATLDADGGFTMYANEDWFEYAPDGRTVLGGDGKGQFLIQDDGSARVDLPSALGGAGWFSFDGKHIASVASSSNAQTLQIYDLPTRTLSLVGPSFTKSLISSPHFTPDGTALIFVEFDLASSVSALERFDLATSTVSALGPILSTGFLQPPLITLAPDK